MDGLPLLTPSCVTAGKEQSVVIEFPRDLPALLVTLDFYYESTGKKLGSVPVVILGPKTVRAKFPEFPKPGAVEVVVKIRHEESSLFPKFKLHVQSPIEAIYHNVPISKASSRSAVLATVLAYLLHSDESQKDREIRSHIDIIVCNILQSLSDVPHWDLTSILSGKHGHDENLLHFCMRHKLDGMATILLQPKNIEGRVYYLQQRGYDNKTPIEIARKNDMKRITEIAQGILSEYENQPSGKHSRPSTPDQKKWRKGRVKRTKSVDTQMSDLGPLPLYLEKKKGGKLAEKLKFKIMGRKSKDVHEISSPQPPALTELDTTEVLQEGCYSYLLKGEPGNTRPASVLERDDDPGMGIGPGPEPASPVPTAEQWGTSKPHRDVPFPLPRIAVSHTTLGFESGSLPATMDRPSPIARFSDELTGSYDSTALPSPPAIETRPAVSGLKKKSLYTAVVTKHYCWASPPYGDIILKEGDRVYVTKEEEGMCLGICNNCFGKFPKDILMPLSTDEEVTLESKDETAYTGSDSGSVTYDEVDPGPDDGYYKVPRNIVRISESDSDSDHLYDHVPVKDQLEMLKHLPEGHYLIVRPRRSSDIPSAPARLLPGHADASSHDTGLDRLGIQYTEQRHTANKAATLGARSTLRVPYENVVLERSPSEPVGINKLMGSEDHFIANPHNNQGEMESTKSIVQEENTTRNQPESENTNFKQESITPATVSETKQANGNTSTVSNDGKIDEEAHDDLAVVKKELYDVEPSALPVPGDSTVATKEERSLSADHQMVDTASREPAEVDSEAHDDLAVVKEELYDVEPSPLPVPGDSTVATKEECSLSADHQMVDTSSQELAEVDSEAHDDLAVVKEATCDVEPSPLPVPGDSTVATKEERSLSADHQMVDTASREPAEVDSETHNDLAVVKEELYDVEPSPLPVPGDSTVATKEERSLSADHQMVDTSSQEPAEVDSEAHDDLAVVKEATYDVEPSPLPVPGDSTVAAKEEQSPITDHQMVDTVSQEPAKVEETHNDPPVVKQEICDVKPSPLPVPGDSTVAAKEEHTDSQMVNTSSQEPTKAENTEDTVRDVIARSNPTPTKRTVLPPKRHSPVPKPRPKKRPLSNLISQKQEVASHSIPTGDGAPNTTPMDERLKMQTGATRDNAPSPKPSQSRQSSSPVPVDKREIEAPGPRIRRKTGPPPIPPKPYASQKGGKEGVKPGNVSSESEPPNPS